MEPVDINLACAQETARMIRQAGGQIVAVLTDVSDQAETQTMARIALKEFSRIDILVNDAGTYPSQFRDRITLDE